MRGARRREHGGSSAARDLLVTMEFRRGHLRRNLQSALRSAIQEGRLAAGTRLPSSRRLATDLQVSRGVVTDAFDQLVAEGYLAVSARLAPTVADVASVHPPRAEAPIPSWRFNFVATTPDVDLFPRRAWLRACERALRDATNDALDYGDHRGRIELRRALSDHLGRVRGVRADPGHIVITQGFTQALDLLCRVLVTRGERSIIFESPSLADEWATARASGLTVEACAVDRDGIRTDHLAGLAGAAVVVTPAHQFPTGAVMAPARRTALVTWATTHDRLIVEDDYDAEFRYDRNAIGALQGLDPGRVVHIGTASKTLAPGLRLGWMSLPAGLVDEVRAAKAAADSGSPAIDQLALATMLETGDYDRYVARARQVYRRRRDLLVEALARRLPNHPD
jgi:GntR family transcriptional regulator/MocR family aminotransferase